MSKDVFEIDIPDTEAGRIHVGLSWEDIYDETTAKSLTRGDIIKAKIATFPKWHSLFIFILFTLFGQALYLQWFGLSLTGNLIVFVITSVLFTLFLYIVLNQKGLFLQFSAKHDDHIGRDKDFQNFDIDLHCFVFNQNKKFLFEINPTNENLINPDELVTVYHSGEDTDGAGVFDDETIHIETKRLQKEYCYFVFAVANDCAHEFDKINALSVRLANSKTDKTLFETAINSNDADGFVFCCIYKNADKWLYKKIEKYIPFNENWKTDIENILNKIG